MKSVVWTVAFAIAAVGSAFAQGEEGAAAKQKAATSGELFNTIAKMDAAVFDAFNAHDVERLMAMFTEDLEFYDDGDGFNDFSKTKADFAKLFKDVPDIRRELLRDTLEVYPLKGHGALQIGQHRFCHKEEGKDDCGIFKFAMIWKQTGGSWKLSRVISYGH